jgi:hypothetical protein
MSQRFVIFLALLALAGCKSSKAKPQGQDSCTACAGDCLEETFSVTDNHHTTDAVDYGTEPPVGGPHNPCWVPWTVYDHEVQTERWVHNLEHGGLAFLYNCPEGCADEVGTLDAYVRALPQGTAVMLPYAEMDARFAAVSWGARITLDCMDTDALQAFYDAHHNHSPETLTADPPASCPPP